MTSKVMKYVDIEELTLNKSFGLDDLSARIFKEAGQQIVFPVTKMFSR